MKLSKSERKLLTMGTINYYVDHQLHLDPEHVMDLVTHGGDQYVIGGPSRKEAADYILSKIKEKLFGLCHEA